MSAPKRLKAGDAQSLTSATSTASSTTSASVNEARPAAETEGRPLWRNYMRLSPEIRRQINNDVLYMGKLFPYYPHHLLPQDANGEEYYEPPIEWIKVLARMQKRLELEGGRLSSDPKAEGEEALYGQNTIVVELDTHDAFFGQYVLSGDPAEPDEEYRLFARNRYITSVQVDLSYRKPDRDGMRRLHEKARSDPRLRDWEERGDWIHDTLRAMVPMLWAPMFESLTTLARLTYLEVDVEKISCPFFCCRLDRHLVRNVFRLDEHRCLETFVLSRLIGPGETRRFRAAIRSTFRERLEAGLTVILREETEEGTWFKDEIELR